MDRIYLRNLPTGHDIAEKLELLVNHTAHVKCENDGTGRIIFQTNNAAAEGLRILNGLELDGHIIEASYSWSVLDNLVRQEKHLTWPTRERLERSPIKSQRIPIIMDGKCMSESSKFVVASSSLSPAASEVRTDKSKSFHRDVQKCRDLFGESRIRPEQRNETMESEIFQMNMKKIQLNSHPYQKNIQQLTFDPDMLLQSFMPLDLFGEDLTCDFIDTISQLRSTIESLANKNVLGIDTEGYSKNVFRPIIGVIQISSNEGNYIIDTIAPKMRNGIKTGLKEILESSKVWKILPGSKSDVIALQRDFGIFMYPIIELQLAVRYWLQINNKPCIVCNAKTVSQCESTRKGEIKQECREPSFERIFKLFYPDADFSKLPQKADWTVRPLHADLIRYAALDSALPLRIWEAMKEGFRSSEPKEFFEAVIRPSNDIALQLYITDKEEVEMRKFIGKKCPSFNSDKYIAFERAFYGRDWLARKLNLPPDQVLPADVLEQVITLHLQDKDEEAQKMIDRYLKEEDATDLILSMKGVPSPEINEAKCLDECSRCHQTGHRMADCTNPRVRTAEDKKKDKERYRAKRKSARDSVLNKKN